MKQRPRINDEAFTELYWEGLPLVVIAERLGVTANTAHRARSRLGLPRRLPLMTPERKAKIEAMLDDGMSFKEIHRTEGANEETLRRHFPGRQWSVAQRVRFQSEVRFLEDRLRGANYAVTADRLSAGREAA